MGQAVSSTQFFVYGKRHFTKTGYLKHVQNYYDKNTVQQSATLKRGQEGADNVDLTGKVICVTGANSGLGKEVATYVACKNAKLYMLCRSKDRAEQARKEILDVAKIPESQIQILLADLSELDQVRNVAKELQNKESNIHCLVCNAGVLLNEQQNSSKGLETTFASHLLGGTYLLTSLLMPQLQATPDSRVVVVTSAGMLNSKLPKWDVLTSYTDTKEAPPSDFKYSGNFAYVYAKRGQVLLVEEWSKMYKDENKVKFVTVHPGWADTPAVDEAYGDKKSWLEPLRSPWEGAEGVAWLTAADASQLESGAFYLDRKTQKKHIAGPFMSEGSFTKNKPEEVQEFMRRMKEVAGL